MGEVKFARSMRVMASRGYVTDEDNQELFDVAELLEAIDALHQPTSGLPKWCVECDVPYPCPTARLLHGEDQ